MAGYPICGHASCRAYNISVIGVLMIDMKHADCSEKTLYSRFIARFQENGLSTG